MLIVSEETSFGMPGADLRLARGDLALRRPGAPGPSRRAATCSGSTLGALERGLDGDAAELGGLEGGERRRPACRSGVRAAPRITVLGMGASVRVASGACEVRATTDAPARHRRRHVVVGVFDGKGVAARRRRRRAAGAVDSGEARPTFSTLALTHADGQALDPRRPGRRATTSTPSARGWSPRPRSGARARARHARRSAGSCRTTSATHVAGALVEGTLLAAYRFDRYKSKDAEDATGARASWSSPPTTTSRAGGRRGARSCAEAANARARPAEHAGQRHDAAGARGAGAGAGRRRAGRELRGARPRRDRRGRDGRVRRRRAGHVRASRS